MARQKKGDIETNYEVRSFDAHISHEEYCALARNPLYIILDNLRSAFNVGSVFRLCDAFRVQCLYLCGYTAHPPHVKLEKTSLGTIEYVPWKHVASTIEVVRELKAEKIAVWAAETTSSSRSYDTVTYPSPVAVVFGNEALGVGREVLSECDALVELPMYGFKNSVNVAACVSAIGYKVLEQFNKNEPPISRRP